MIKIMKASAGSGKTYHLTKTYITLLLESEDRYAYRHILAVTFTNKATAEMKSRILKELHVLSRDTEHSKYLSDLVPAVKPSVEDLRNCSARILSDILHDYSAFSVSTIDKFFQMTLKAFSREIGQFASYQVELDRTSLVHESVDRILDSLTEDRTELIGWLNAGVMEQLRQGRRVNVEASLYEIADRLKSEEFREMAENEKLDASVMFSKEKLDAVRDECDKVIAEFENSVVKAAAGVRDILESCQVNPGDFNRGFMSNIIPYAEPDPGSAVAFPSKSVLDKSKDKNLWFSKTKAPKFLPLVDGALDGPLAAFVSLFDHQFQVYATALLLRKQSFSLGLAGDLQREFDALLKEKNVLSLDDSNHLLRDIIDGSDAPFVYEKLGVRFEDFLLDEFQDTSVIQWQNFHPLLKESDANNRDNLVVGDVKQSIYRWRGSDWDLLATQLPEQFASAKVETLDSNWRSCRSVVSFNSDFFANAAKRMDMEKVYADVSQNVKSEDSQPGYVKVRFCKADAEMQAVLDSINEVREAGAGFGDIAVLVRKNSEGGKLAAFLLENDIPVVSDDSLELKSSSIVRRLVSLLSYVENPEDTVSCYLAAELGLGQPERYHSLVDLCEGLLRSLKDSFPEDFEGETLYIQSFMDYVSDWSSINGHNLLHFLKEWSEKKSPFLSSPADQDAVRIMTIHKSKGLEFPHVIFPFAEEVTLYKADWHWCRPDDKDAGLPLSSSAIYPVQLFDNTEQTLFSEDLKREKYMQVVDNMNTFYVALTRAEKSLCVIAVNPPSSYLKDGKISDYSQLLYSYVSSANAASFPEGPEHSFTQSEGYSEFVLGEPYDFKKLERKALSDEKDFPSSYVSIPVGDRLRLSSDSSDFFSEDGTTGTVASRRLNGIVLHDIMSSVRYPSELKDAVNTAVRNGRLTEAEGREDYAFLSGRMASVASRGWFPESPEAVVSNEVSIIGTDGKEWRPDRVVISDGEVIIIDYKFGDLQSSYKKQVSRYMDLYRKMGYSSVSGYIWYLYEDKVEQI